MWCVWVSVLCVAVAKIQFYDKMVIEESPPGSIPYRLWKLRGLKGSTGVVYIHEEVDPFLASDSVVFRQATAAANQLPPDFTHRVAVSTQTIPLLASGASDGADWYFLAGRDISGHAQDGKFERSVYVTQTISVREVVN